MGNATYTSHNGTEVEILTLSDIRRAHKGHWFDRDTMKFFATTLPDGEYVRNIAGRVFFISGERDTWSNQKRAYTIREYVPASDDIRTIGEFQQYRTPDQARNALRKMAKEVK